MDTRDNAPLIAAGGGFLLFISLFLDWVAEVSFWEFSDITDILLALIGLLALAAGASIATGNPIKIPGGPGTVYTAGVVAFSIVAFLVLESDDKKLGMFIGLIGTVGIVVGGLGLSRGSSAPPAATPPSATTTSAPPPPAPPPA